MCSFQWILLGMLHTFYLSTCEITIQSDRSWEGIVRVFHDDLEDALQHRFGMRPNLDEEGLKNQIENIQTYLNEHLLFTHKGGKAEYRIIKATRQNDILEILIRGKSWSEKPLTIRNNLLMELFDSQKNIMTIKATQNMMTLYFNKVSASQQIEAL